VLEERRKHQPGMLHRNATQCAVRSADHCSDLLFAAASKCRADLFSFVAASKCRADLFSFVEYKSGHGLDQAGIG